MDHPYRHHEGSALWVEVDAELAALEENGDIELRTAREYVIGALCQRIAQSNRSPHPVSSTGQREVERAADGTITNPRELSDDALIGKKVTCPACESMVFKMWPEGWDAHAAHRCGGVVGTTSEERKADFKARFGHLFR